MGASGYVHVHVQRVIAETEKAFLVDLGEDYDDHLWIAKSQIANPEEYGKDDCDFTMSITEWAAKKLGIEEE